MSPSRLRAASVPVAVGAFAFLVSVIAIGTPSIWYDEAATVTSATRGWTQLFAEVQHVDAVHALYYAFMHVWFDLVGYSPVTLRLPSALAIGVAGGLVVLLGRRLGDERLAVIAGLAFAVLPRTVWAGGEGRSYAITVSLAAGLTLQFLRASRRGRTRDWVGYGILAVVACYLFLYLALIIVAHAITVAILRRHWRGFLFAAASAAVVVAPAARIMSGQTRQIGWIGHHGPPAWNEILTQQWFLISTAYATVAALVLVAGAAVAILRRRTDDRAAVLLPLVIVPSAVLLGATFTGNSIYVPRYLSMCLPFVALLGATAIRAIPWHAGRLVAAVVVVALAIPIVITERAPAAKEDATWNQVANFVQDNAARDGSTAIVWGTVRQHVFTTARIVKVAYPGAFRNTMDPTFLVSGATTGTLWDTSSATADSLGGFSRARSVFLLTSTVSHPELSTTTVLRSIGFEPAGEKRFGWMSVVEYRRVASAPTD